MQVNLLILAGKIYLKFADKFTCGRMQIYLNKQFAADEKRVLIVLRGCDEGLTNHP